MQPILCKDNGKSFITLPITVKANQLNTLAQEHFTSDIIVPVAINRQFVILDGETVVELPEQVDLKKLFDSIYTTERNGFAFSVAGVFYGELYFEENRIKCDIMGKNQTKNDMIDESFVDASELLKLSEDFLISEGQVLNLSEVYAKMFDEVARFDHCNNFTTIMSIANVDLDLENDTLNAMLVDTVNNQRHIGSGNIKAFLKENKLKTLEVIKSSRDESGGNKNTITFDPVPCFTLSAPAIDYDASFERLYEENLKVNASELLARVYKLLATEHFID